MLNEKAFLVQLEISRYNGTKTDKAVTEQTNLSHHAQEGAGNYRKRLFEKEALDTINSIVGEARTAHRALTLSWSYKGVGLLPVENLERYREIMNKLKERFRIAVDRACNNYEANIEKARSLLGNMFNLSDYISVNDFKGRHGFEINIDTISDKNDIRVNLSENEINMLRQTIQAQEQVRIETAMRDLWDRVHEVTNRFIETLPKYNPEAETRKEKNAFHDTIVTNVRELCELLPALNFTNDKNLAELNKEVEEKLAKLDPEKLRKSQETRDKAVEDAQAIVKKMKKYM